MQSNGILANREALLLNAFLVISEEQIGISDEVPPLLSNPRPRLVVSQPVGMDPIHVVSSLNPRPKGGNP